MLYMLYWNKTKLVTTTASFFFDSFQMAPRPRLPDDDDPQVSIIHNHGKRGLAIYDKSEIIHYLPNFHWKFVSELRDSSLDLVGYLVAIKVDCCLHQGSKDHQYSIFLVSNIRIYWAQIFIRRFVCINFVCTNIFGHSFVSILFVRIYSGIRSWVC